MVLAYWGLEVAQNSLAHKLKTIPGIGTPGPNIRYLASREVQVRYREGILADLVQAIETDIPPIALVRTRELPYWPEDTPHAVVITGIADDDFWVHDPAKESPNIRVNQGDFYLAWDLMANLYILLRPL
jgi:uncharacterized protein YvpB